jgi:hypothetical protein
VGIGRRVISWILFFLEGECLVGGFGGEEWMDGWMDELRFNDLDLTTTC